VLPALPVAGQVPINTADNLKLRKRKYDHPEDERKDQNIDSPNHSQQQRPKVVLAKAKPLAGVRN
jgi:hypothetical protein